MLDVSLVSTVAGSGARPAAVVYPVAVSADESPYANITRQRERSEFAVLIISDGIQTIDDLRLDVRSAIIGYQQSVDHEPIEYTSGRPEDVGVGADAWLETYNFAIHID